jgi:hypothetical protein
MEELSLKPFKETVVLMKPSYKYVLVITMNCFVTVILSPKMVNKLNIQQGFRIGVDTICSSVH